MLCFVFSALVVLLDQLFKRWAVIALAAGKELTIIPGIIGLTYVENTGAAFGIFSDMRWPLAIVQFLCALIIISILLRYNDGFWGTLGLSAVLGGAIGNLIDRVLYGYVVDMFEFKFVSFAIFNIADIFITLGGITFCVFFIVSSYKSKEQPPDTHSPESAEVIKLDDVFERRRRLGQASPEDTKPIRGPYAAPQEPAPPAQLPQQQTASQQQTAPQQQTPPSQTARQQTPQNPAPKAEDILADSAALELYAGELTEDMIMEEYDLDKILAEYGFEDNEN